LSSSGMLRFSFY